MSSGSEVGHSRNVEPRWVDVYAGDTDDLIVDFHSEIGSDIEHRFGEKM